MTKIFTHYNMIRIHTHFINPLKFIKSQRAESPKEVSQQFVLRKGCDVGVEAFGGHIFHEHIHVTPSGFSKRLIQFPQLFLFPCSTTAM